MDQITLSSGFPAFVVQEQETGNPGEEAIDRTNEMGKNISKCHSITVRILTSCHCMGSILQSSLPSSGT